VHEDHLEGSQGGVNKKGSHSSASACPAYVMTENHQKQRRPIIKIRIRLRSLKRERCSRDDLSIALPTTTVKLPKEGFMEDDLRAFGGSKS